MMMPLQYTLYHAQNERTLHVHVYIWYLNMHVYTQL